MNRYILDTNHASVAMDPGPLQSHMAAAVGDHFFLPAPVLGELWYMVCYSARFHENSRRLDDMLQRLSILPYGMTEANEFGRVKAELRRLGKPIPQIDAQIVATARVHDMVVLTVDTHFQHVTNLKIENWLPARS